MSQAQWLTGDVFQRLAELEDGTVDLICTSPPFWRQRAYLPTDHPDIINRLLKDTNDD